jgi:hydroxymethylpyrimidine/phosphomethylpyrimidine kinase
MSGVAAKGRVLIAAGSDSGGGAGIQADIKTVTALGGYAMTAITALTAQNTQGVFGVVGVEPDFIVQQMRLVIEDIGVDVVKTGMLHNSEVIEAVCGIVEEYDLPLVADPVMFAKGGHALLEAEAVATVRNRLIPLASVITPNLPEASALIETPVETVEDMAAAAGAFAKLGASAVLLKGGHLDSEILTDFLYHRSVVSRWDDTRIETQHTHGTGCTLASAVATGLAQGMPLKDAVDRARFYVRDAILGAPGFGNGHGPLHHGHTVSSYPKGK